MRSLFPLTVLLSLTCLLAFGCDTPVPSPAPSGSPTANTGTAPPKAFTPKAGAGFSVTGEPAEADLGEEVSIELTIVAGGIADTVALDFSGTNLEILEGGEPESFGALEGGDAITRTVVVVSDAPGQAAINVFVTATTQGRIRSSAVSVPVRIAGVVEAEAEPNPHLTTDSDGVPILELPGELR